MSFEIVEGLERVDFATVHSWLSTAYWSEGVSRERVEKAARGSSLVVGAYADGQQLGYCRAVSDRTTFGWLCDVFVSPSVRGQGIAKAMVGYILEHPEHQGLRRWLLATKDAHGIYRECGFESLPMPERWMVKLWDTSF